MNDEKQMPIELMIRFLRNKKKDKHIGNKSF